MRLLIWLFAFLLYQRNHPARRASPRIWYRSGFRDHNREAREDGTVKEEVIRCR